MQKQVLPLCHPAVDREFCERNLNAIKRERSEVECDGPLYVTRLKESSALEGALVKGIFL